MKLKYIIFSSVLLMMCASCNDFLNEKNPNAIDANDYMNTEVDVQKAVAGIYQGLRSGNCIGNGSTLFMEERSDNTGRNDNQSAAGVPFQFNDFSIVPTNVDLKSHWSMLYEVIYRANYVLENIDKATISSEDNRKNYMAEAKFLRALMYFHLVRTWGDVPLSTEVLGTYADITAATVRVKKEEVYAQIVKDLTEALDCTLPDLQNESGKGHTCKAAINGLLGQVYLTMATTTSGDQSENLRLSNQYLLACYNARSFGSLSDIPYEDVFDVNKKSTCPEIIFQIVYKQGDKDYSSRMAANNQARGETINSQVNSNGGGEFVKPDLVKEYELSDVRKDFSVKFGNDPKVQTWFVTKFRDASDAAGKLGYGGNDWILMRYADIILMLAEVNSAMGNTTEAIAYLDQVRERAQLPSYATMQTDPSYTSKYPTLKLAILHERRVELAFENQRWYDLLRNFTSDELVTFFHAKNQDDYGLSKLENFGPKDYYFPIPFDEYKLNPTTMWQNTGY